MGRLSSRRASTVWRSSSTAPRSDVRGGSSTCACREVARSTFRLTSVDQAQWLVDSDTATPALLSARAWSTRVPAEAFRRITGEEGFPSELQPFVDGDALSYRCNAELVYRIGRVTASAATRWNLSPSPGGGDASHNVVHGTRADIHLEQSARTGHRRRVFVEPRADAAEVVRALRAAIATWQAELPGVEVVPTGSDTYEVSRAALARRRPRDTLSPGPRRVLENRRRSPLAYGTRPSAPWPSTRCSPRPRPRRTPKTRRCRRDGSPDDPARD
jgi:hypothetical protein